MPANEESDSARYSRLLHPKGEGFPLFHPQPFDDLPRAARKIGTRIGDVGIVTRNGAFDPIFNVLDRAEDNRHGVPDDFEQVTLRHNAIAEQRLCHPLGSDISNTRINKKRLDVDVGFENNVFVPAGAGAVVEVSTNSKETAILLLPDGASRWDLRPLQIFRDYALKHGQSWYAFVNGELGRMIGSGDLYLITGVTKSTSWSVAAVKNQSGDGKVSLKLKAAQMGNAGVSCAWEWESASSWVNSGPQRREGEESWRDNQTVFLRGFKVALRSKPRPLKQSLKVLSIVESKWSNLTPKTAFVPYSQPQPQSGSSSANSFSQRLPTQSRPVGDQQWPEADSLPQSPPSTPESSSSSDDEQSLNYSPNVSSRITIVQTCKVQ
ncbi:hypothetical protein FB451DRAFT_1084400 [Mycena latifolia]|nr:hypothetical protein FB451DRAFT_1084400 [Mycena latifolia]